jgi:hypothetical protein
VFLASGNRKLAKEHANLRKMTMLYAHDYNIQKEFYEECNEWKWGSWSYCGINTRVGSNEQLTLE